MLKNEKTVSVLTPLGSNVNMRCRGQQGRGFSSLPQPIKRHEALKNDAVRKGVKKRKAGINPPRLFYIHTLLLVLIPTAVYIRVRYSCIAKFYTISCSSFKFDFSTTVSKRCFINIYYCIDHRWISVYIYSFD